MRTKRFWIVLSLVVVNACLVSAFFGYQGGYSWGRRAEQRSALSLPRTVDVYGCGVDRFVRLGPNGPVKLHELLTRLQPLPSMVNGVSVLANGSTKNMYYLTLSEASATNGMGAFPLTGGERVVLVQAIK